MINITCSRQDIRTLNYWRNHHDHPRVRRKMMVLWLKSQDFAHKDILRIAGISHTTLSSYLKAFQSGGVEKLKEVNFRQPESELMQYEEEIVTYFRKHPPASVKEAMAKIEELTGIRRSESSIGNFLRAIGMRPRKVRIIPAKADPDKQEEFKNKELEPRLEKAKQGKRAVFFVDAAHFVLAPFIGILWSFGSVFLRAPAGRKRFNVLGALNAITHELIMVTNATYINAESVCELLRRIALLNLEIPVTLVLDNARYQKCKIVFALAATLNIELLYLPSYSPNLNLIERLWKFVKKRVLYSKYYSNFDGFRHAISDCLSKTGTIYKNELDALLTLKFQSFKKCQFVTA